MASYGPLLLLAGLAVVAAFLVGRWTAPRERRVALPRDWALMPRPVLNSDERRTLRQLREALPQHTVLAKLPLVRLCLPRDSRRLHYWYDLLGSLHVSFAICSANGRVLAAIDLDNGRGRSRRAQTIKQGVLTACRIRYLFCRADELPSSSELQLLVPQQGSATLPLPPNVMPGLQQARSNLSDTVRTRRAERSARWADSGFPQDSFFAPDSRIDSGPSSELSSLDSPAIGARGPS